MWKFQEWTILQRSLCRYNNWKKEKESCSSSSKVNRWFHFWWSKVGPYTSTFVWWLLYGPSSIVQNRVHIFLQNFPSRYCKLDKRQQISKDHGEEYLNDKARMAKVAPKFESWSNGVLKGAIGAVDGWLVKIRWPTKVQDKAKNL